MANNEIRKSNDKIDSKTAGDQSLINKQVLAKELDEISIQDKFVSPPKYPTSYFPDDEIKPVPYGRDLPNLIGIVTSDRNSHE